MEEPGEAEEMQLFSPREASTTMRNSTFPVRRPGTRLHGRTLETVAAKRSTRSCRGAEDASG